MEKMETMEKMVTMEKRGKVTMEIKRLRVLAIEMLIQTI